MRCLPTGYWFDGHWVCLWCKNIVQKEPPPVEDISDLHKHCYKIRLVEIKEIPCENKL